MFQICLRYFNAETNNIYKFTCNIYVFVTILTLFVAVLQCWNISISYNSFNIKAVKVVSIYRRIMNYGRRNFSFSGNTSFKNRNDLSGNLAININFYDDHSQFQPKNVFENDTVTTLNYLGGDYKSSTSSVVKDFEILSGKNVDSFMKNTRRKETGIKTVFC